MLEAGTPQTLTSVSVKSGVRHKDHDMTSTVDTGIEIPLLLSNSVTSVGGTVNVPEKGVYFSGGGFSNLVSYHQ